MNNTFWTENLSSLFNNIQIVPIGNLCLSEQMNAISRLVIVVFVVMWLFDFKYALYFLTFSLLFIIIIYYIQRNKMKQNCKEKYSKEPNVRGTNVKETNVREAYNVPNRTYVKDLGVREAYNAPVSEGYVKTQEPLSAEGYVKTMGINSYNSNMNSTLQNTSIQNNNGKKYKVLEIPTSQSIPFCNDAVSIDSPESFANGQLNQSLAGKYVNRNVNLKPVMVPPIVDIDYWKLNNNVVISAINSDGFQQDMYLSGYGESTCCDYLPGANLPEGTQVEYTSCEAKPTFVNGNKRYNREDAISEGYTSVPVYPRKIQAPLPGEERLFDKIIGPQAGFGEYSQEDIQDEGDLQEGYSTGYDKTTPTYDQGSYKGMDSTPVYPRKIQAPLPGEERLFDKVIGPHAPRTIVRGNNSKYSIENYEPKEPQNKIKNGVEILPNHSGWVNTECGYNPDQALESGLPSNLPVGNCQQDPIFKRYNENLFTQTITPGVYMNNQVVEPINSNIGISFQQQFEPVTCKADKEGLKYTLHDPRIVNPDVNKHPRPVDKANYDNVYDPRFYGYGTSYRSYLEPVTGQTRFMYDDVNAIRMPNYVTRSKIDHLSFADKYGPMEVGEEYGNPDTPYIRQLADDKWLRDSLEFRNDMTLKLMRKTNSEAWQQRQAPIGLRPVGSYKR
jgi:hypothetical protein